MNTKRLFALGWRFLVLTVLYVVLQSIGYGWFEVPVDSAFVAEHQQAMMVGSIISAAVHTGLVMMLISRSSWSGWPLMLAVGFSFYGVTHFLSALEVVWFGPAMGIPANAASSMFLAPLLLALVWVPLAAILLGRGRRKAEDRQVEPRLEMRAGQWAWKLALLAPTYLAIYFVFGLLVAWRNPELRAMYGNGTNAQVFNLWLILFQVLRALLWVCFALPVIRTDARANGTGSPGRGAAFQPGPVHRPGHAQPVHALCQRPIVALFRATVVQFPLWLAGDGAAAVAAEASGGGIGFPCRLAGRRPLMI